MFSLFLAVIISGFGILLYLSYRDQKQENSYRNNSFRTCRIEALEERDFLSASALDESALDDPDTYAPSYTSCDDYIEDTSCYSTAAPQNDNSEAEYSKERRTTMTITLDSMTEIRKWFAKNSEVEIDLPDKHFGRPGDSAEIPTRVGIEGNFFIVELENKYSQAMRKFIFYGDTQYQIVDNCLEVSNFDSLVFERQRNDESGLATNLYDEGIVRFLPVL